MTAERIPPAGLSPMIGSFRFWFRVGLVLSLLALAVRAHADEVVVTDREGIPWTMRIGSSAAETGGVAELLIPPAPEAEPPMLAQHEHAAVPAPDAGLAVEPATGDHAGVNIAPDPTTEIMTFGRSYEFVYRSIPFSHTEYLANPSYRHEAAMEILFGQLRPMTVHKVYQPRVIQNIAYGPYQPYRFAHFDYWQRRPPVFHYDCPPGTCY